MAYFRTQAEALHLALSSDGLHWRALNGNRPVFHSSVGNQSVRDPFLLRDAQGKFHLLSSNAGQMNTIFHAVSDDLITWRDERLLPVMESVAGTRNCWAPEAFWESESDCYRVHWSSTTPHSGGEMDAHGYNHRIWSVTTRDFQEFSAPAPFFDPGYNVIDATLCASPQGGYLMAFKDERGDNTRDTPYKAIRVATARRACGPWTVKDEFVSPPLTEGPILFRAQERWLLFFDHFADGHFSGLASDNGLDWKDVSEQIRFPEGPRHASVLHITNDEAARLENVRWCKQLSL